ncbi:MAG: UvrD-helicase domain-containing protein [Lachnospiraceae bacterium]|nr:UvrD-helicase domain-containing protein [Lachnospiraceae bacterium]
MMRTDLDEQRKRERIKTPTDKSVFVEAGAGAGKTTLIVSRLINQLKQGILPEHIVVITFTNKATEELQERIIKELKDAGRKAGLSEEERKNLNYAQQNMDRLHISTIHSFCFKLLKENALTAGVPVDIEMMEEPERLAEQEVLFEDWYARLDRSIMNQLYALFPGSNSYMARNCLKDAYAKIATRPQEVEVYRENTDFDKYEDMIEQGNQLLKDFAGEIYRILPDKNKRNMESVFHDLLNEEEKAVNKPFRTAIEELYRFDGNQVDMPEEAIWDINKLLKSVEKAFNKQNGHYEKDIAQGLNEALSKSEIYKNLDEYIKQYEFYCTDLITSLAQDAREYYRKHRNVRTVSNDSLLEQARDLVCRHSELARQLAKKYRHLYIDEFQDVDHMQAELALCFKENGSRLFLVGDPKQSIYRFRGAEPKLFDKIKKDMTEDKDSEVFELDDNYRSSGKVIDWVNTVFKQRFTDIKYRDMKVGGTKNISGHADRLLDGVYKYDKDNRLEIVEEDAEQLADVIDRLVSGEYCIFDGENAPRPVRYKDFLVLTWTTKNIPAYTQAFKDKEIPFLVDGKEPLSVYVVLNRFRLLYRYLARYEKKYIEGAIEALSQDDTEVLERKSAVDFLRTWKKETKELDGKGKAGYLSGKTEYLIPRGRVLKEQEMNSIQTKLVQMVEKVCATATSANAYLLAEEFDRYVSTELEHELVLEENADAVRIMNMHKAKGLEAGVVILADRVASKKMSEQTYMDSDTAVTPRKYTLYTDYRYGQFNGVISGLSQMPEKVAAGEEEKEQEEVRKQYVAATRAKQALIIMNPIRGSREKGKKDYFSDYMDAVKNSLADKLRKNGDMMEDGVEDGNGESGENSVRRDAQKKCFQKKERTEEAAQREEQYISITPSGLEVGGNSANADETKSEGDAKSEVRPKGNIFGTVMHRCFELMMIQIMSPDAENRRKNKKLADIFAGTGQISRIIRQALVENYSDIKSKYEAPDESGNPRYKKEMLKYQEHLEIFLNDFLDDKDVADIISRTEEYYTEYPFSFDASKRDAKDMFEKLAPYLEKKKIEIGDEQRVWVNGTMDLVLHLQDGNVIILDYKSDTKGDNVSIEKFDEYLNKYNGQLELYKYAATRIFDVTMDKVETILYHLY